MERGGGPALKGAYLPPCLRSVMRCIELALHLCSNALPAWMTHCHMDASPPRHCAPICLRSEASTSLPTPRWARPTPPDSSSGRARPCCRRCGCMLSNAVHATPSVRTWALSMPHLLCTNGSRRVLCMVHCAVQCCCTGWRLHLKGMLAAMHQQADCAPAVSSVSLPIVH